MQSGVTRENSTSSFVENEVSADSQQFVSFFIQDDEFAVDIKIVQEIIKFVPITHLPRAPEFVEGVINLRGQIVPVIDLRERFRIGKIEHGRKTRIIVVNMNQKWIGFIVDSVSEVLRIPIAHINDPPVETIGDGVEFIRGIAEINERLIVILDFQKVLTQQEIQDIGTIKSLLENEENEVEETE